MDAATIAQPLPVGAVVVLDWGEALYLQPLRGSDAITAVLPAACYRPQVLDALSAWPQQTKAWLTLLEHTPVYRLQRPKEFMQIPEATYLLSQLPALS